MQLTSCARYLGYLLPCLAFASACERRGFSLADDVPVSNGATSAVGGVTSIAGSSSTSGGTVAGDPCMLDGNKATPPTFTEQAVSYSMPARKEVYALVTDAEAKALRDGAPLVPPPATEATATPLSAIVQSLRTSTSEQRRRMGELLSSRFGSSRSTWPNPWALRLVGHPGSEHMNALRVVLRDQALIVRLSLGSPHVLDMKNETVPLEVAFEEPDRIAAIYYQLDNTQPVSGITDRCENGMREVALGNEAMVEEWSLGTTEILDRLNGDLDLLLSLFEISRKCSSFDRGGTFRSITVCQTWQTFAPSTEYLAYQWSLATPVESYKPTPQNLASLIQALQEDRAEPAPFVVKPEPPPSLGSGGAGSGGEGGGGGSEGGVGGAGGVDSAAGQGGVP